MNTLVTLHAALLADAVPEWVHLVPSGSFRGADGRGPYQLDNAEAVAAASMEAGKLAIDENHAIDLSAPKGGPSPARGWIVELQARPDGLWGRVEWTEAGKSLLADRAYRGISPAIATRVSDGRVMKVMRASLVNDPNLPLTTLHSRINDMDALSKMIAALGLKPGATEADAVTQAASLHASHAALTGLAPSLGLKADALPTDILRAVETTLQAAVADRKKIAAAAGLKEEASADAIVTSLQARKTGGEEAQLRDTIVSLQGRLDTLSAQAAHDKAVAVVDAAIAAGKPIRPLRDHYIARHAKDPASVETELNAIASIHAGGLPRDPKAQAGTVGALSADEAQVCELMGLDPVAFAKTKAQDTVLG